MKTELNLFHSKIKFLLFLLAYLFGLTYLATALPIGSHEATIYYTDTYILYYLTHFANGWFENGLDFRFPFVFFAFLNIPLFFIMSRLYLHHKNDSYLATMIFVLLPGIITSSILVNIAVLVITLVLLFVIFFETKQAWGQGIIMILLLLVHDTSVIFFIGVAIFSLFKRNNILFTFSILLAVINIFYFNGLDVAGKPKGEFLELFGLYIALFSPLVFIYFFYALYRIWLREKKNILWYISFTAFLLSIVLSLRQQVNMTDFAPYVIVSVVLMVVVYHQTLYVRLPQFQKRYRVGFHIVLISLVLSALIIFLHKQFFYILDDKSQHFAYSFYEPYWQMLELKEIGKDCYTVSNRKVQYQFKYYGIDACEEVNVSNIHK